MPPSASDLVELTAVILAGGLGTRLRAAVADRPKVMAEVAGRPFLSFWLDELVRLGVGRAVLCTGYLGGMIRDHYGASYGPLTLTYVQEERPLGTGGALAAAVRLGTTDPILALNGDSFLKADLRAFHAWYRDRGLQNALMVTRVPDLARFGGVRLLPDDQVAEFLEKGRAGPGLINAGVYLLRAGLLAGLPADRPTSLERDVFPALAGTGLHGYPCDGSLLDIGTPESYRQAEAFFGQEPGAP